jgi:hypothetical protein
MVASAVPCCLERFTNRLLTQSDSRNGQNIGLQDKRSRCSKVFASAGELHPRPSTTVSSSLTMLPRHLRRVVLSAATPAHIRLALRSRSAPLALSRPLPAFSACLPSGSSSFHSSARRQNEPPKSPFQTFVEVLRDELRKNRELQDNVKQLQGDVDKLQDSEAMKRARAAYERARVSKQ